MRIRSLVGTLILTAAALGAPALLIGGANTQTLGSCDGWPFDGNVCQVLEHCWDTDDPACDQPSNEPNDARRYAPTALPDY